MKKANDHVIIFKTEDDKISVDVRFDDDTVWLTMEDMSELFEKSRSTINEHILNIYSEGELDESSSKRKIGISDFSTKPTNFYNLDVIISVGYRVKSLRGTQFRQWATKRLNEYIRKGFTLDDDRLKNGGGRYFRELLQRIRDELYRLLDEGREAAMEGRTRPYKDVFNDIEQEIVDGRI